MARKDDYENAFKIAAAELQTRNPRDVAGLSGATFDADQGRWTLDFIGRSHAVDFPEISVSYPDNPQETAPLTEQVLLLHYLNQARGAPFKNEMITYREVPAGEFYYPAFVKRAEAPMLSVFGPDPGLLPRLAPLLGGMKVSDQGDGAAVFPALPRVPLTLVVWGGDEEFPPSGRILFDRSVQHYLSTEDVAWLSGMVVYRLMRLAAQHSGGK